MSDGTNQGQQLSDMLGLVWNTVIQQVNKLLDAHAKFGFFKFHANLNPSLEDVLRGFEFVDFALSKLLEGELLEYDEKRVALNSKQCILKMKELAVALQGQNEQDYDRIIGELNNQAKF